MVSNQNRREEVVSAMVGANTGRSNEDEEDNLPQTPTTIIKTTLPPMDLNTLSIEELVGRLKVVDK
jgi:hypothetical protein